MGNREWGIGNRIKFHLEKEDPKQVSFPLSFLPPASCFLFPSLEGLGVGSASFLLTLVTLFLPQRICAQIIPDNTLPINSAVQTTDTTNTIINGTTVGNNLFHSFSQFNLSQSETAYFNNLTTITNIITRVTGGQASTIDGILSANGAANLLLINPRGITFNSNAQLNIGGSFLASTADSLVFADGSIFSASNPNTPPLLAINVPVGLQYGANPGGIRVENTGHNLTSAGNPIFSTLDKSSNPLGLRVQPNQTLALIGGEVTVDGGLLTAESGRIEIGSIVQSRVNLNSTANGWTLNYPEVDQFGNIEFTAAALVDTSGNGGSGIQLVGKQITMTDASLVLVDSQGNLPGGKIVLQASESVTISGNSPPGIFTGLRSQTVAAGKGAEILVSSPSLILQEGSRIQSISFSNGEGGDINLEVPNLVQLIGASPVRTGATSDIAANVLGSGNGGNIKVSTTNFSALDGGGLAAVTDGAGNAGNVTINATNSVEVIGFNPLSTNPTRSILAAATRSSGAGGQLTINTGRLTVRDGGRITASTIANGLGGSLTINASESVVVGRIGEGTSLRSIIAAGAEANLPIHRIRGLSPIPAGDSGTMTINTPKLIVFEQGRVGVDNQGLGNAGELKINASQIRLDTEGIISASTESGQGGNITLNVQDLLLLRRGSQITAEAGGTGDGGNITINSAAIALLEGSLINANAFQGTGGNIQVTLQGLFIAPDSLITASSQLGIDGIVQINDSLLDPSSGLNQLPENLTDSTDQIVAGCTADANSQFMITGRGGLPEDPTTTIRGQTI
ncbi:MAG: filamentous hemagglutinin N-terminal domain-containing protein, partial [Symploca sp. SIO3E6]|nr:filamentous hemagglutinin N-terminal domain-containing protein [Caldora sp. SIO3E6]